MDPRSIKSLASVHPDLIKVMKEAFVSTKIPFVIIQGLRTLEEEKANVAKGVSTTLHSRHLPNAAGLACAVDVAALDHGKVDWHPILYQGIAAAIFAAGHDLNIPVEWGGNWKTFKDWGHFQLPWRQYP